VRADGRLLKRLTIYLDASLAKRLKLAAVEDDRDVSGFVAEVLLRELDRRRR
jgi:hypothetical protein